MPRGVEVLQVPRAGPEQASENPGHVWIGKALGSRKKEGGRRQPSQAQI